MDTKDNDRSGQTRRRKRPGADGAQQRPKRRQKPEGEKKPSADVVYLPPKPFSRSRLALHLVTIIAIVLAIVLGVSVFFKVERENTQVSGHVKYTVQDIVDASGIRDGENLLTLSIPGISGRIMDTLPYIKSVRVGIRLPDTVVIEVIEAEITYAIEAEEGGWWLVSSEGKIVDKALEGAQEGYTKILGIVLDAPEIGQQAVTPAPEPEYDENGQQIPVVNTPQRQLQIALDITGFLEKNGIIGSVASIDVSDTGNIELWYGQQFQVELGNDTQLEYKIRCLKGTLDNEKMKNERGVLDITFTILPDKVVYTPFTTS